MHPLNQLQTNRYTNKINIHDTTYDIFMSCFPLSFYGEHISFDVKSQNKKNDKDTEAHNENKSLTFFIATRDTDTKVPNVSIQGLNANR